MKIAEISSPELRQHLKEPQSHLLLELQSSIQQCEQLSPETPIPETLSTNFRALISQLASDSPFSNSTKLQIWKLSYRLWNTCVDLSNAATIRSSAASEDRAHLRQVAADLLYIAGEVSGVPSPATKCASFYYKTGLIWHDLRRFDLASCCFEKATDLTAKIEIDEIGDTGERKLLLDLNIARSRTAWEASDKNLAVTLLNRTKNLLFGCAENYIIVASQYLAFGKSVLAKNEVSEINEALKLMNEALDLSEKGLRIVRKPGETLALKELRSKTLRFVAASHLQAGEFESVLKCIRVLRDGCLGGHHPSLAVLAMKAWLGLQRYGEAEKELRSMVVNKEIPEGVLVSAVEAYFQAAGVSGAETAKSVFLGLLERCHVSACSAVRVVHRVVGEAGEGCSDGSRVRAKVVAELVSDERVVALFAGDGVAKERTTMHAILWNCAADHFRAKDYGTSAEMFEKSMLYVPYDIEKRILRAKGFRVLCLCHLGLSQLDRAEEYINEAEKLEPSIASAFLKFKIYLQKRDNSGAITQMQAMTTCLDFSPDFLALSAHEAVACCALPVAVASLSNLLHFYASGKAMPTSEVIVLRTLLTILTQEPNSEEEVLKYMKRAQTRTAELGPDHFFGKGEVGKRERNWFAVNSWNFGTRTGKANKYELCAAFFRLASEFYRVMVDGEVQENSVMVCKSLISTVSGMIAAEKQRKTALVDTEVKQALDLLDRAGKILASVSAMTLIRSCDDQMTTLEPNLFFIYTLDAYDLNGRLGLETQQLLTVKSFAASKACEPKHLLQIGLIASEGPRSNPEVATFALNSCLSCLLASPSPDYQAVALTVRKLIATASIHKGDRDDNAVYEIYKQAYRIMVGLKAGEYPVEEGKWLATSAWNRAALPVRLGQVEVSKKWMNVGLELAGHVPGLETYKASMEYFLAAYEKKVNGHDDG